MKVPPAPSSLFFNHDQPSTAACAVEKSLDAWSQFWQQRPDVEVQNFSFPGRSQGVAGRAFSLKQQRCPHCGCAESLNRHNKLYGNDPERAGAQAQRGQRVFCSNRGQRGGCGKTFSVFLAQVLPRHTVQAGQLWHLLQELLQGTSIQAAVQALRLPFVLGTVYGLLRRLRQRLDGVRCALRQRQKEPQSSQSDPLLHTAEHLQSVFREALCPVSQFQTVFEQPLMG